MDSRQKLVSNAGVKLLATLDYVRALQSIAELAVTEVAETCSVHLLTDDGAIRLVAHSKRHANSPERATESIRVIETGQAVARESYVCVPIRARGRTLGSITLFPGIQKSIVPEDLEMIQEIAHRAASAIENATHYKNAQRAIHIRDEFLSIAAHELKTPITSVRLRLQSLLHMAKKDSLHRISEEQLKKALTNANAQIMKLDHLIDDLLDVSRIEMGSLKLQLREMDLRDLVVEVQKKFAGEILSSHNRITVHAPEPVHGEFDRLRMEQVLINLLNNAIRYGEGRSVEISLTQLDDRIRLSVSDHGLGISHRMQSRIFERFERAVSAQHYGGLGLGLYIARQIVTAHGGAIHVASEVGKGSTFTVELPLRMHKTEKAVA